MFKRKKKKDKADKFNDVMNKAVCDTVRNALESILKIEYKADDSDKIDYEMTTRVIKSQARIALDLISTIKAEKEI